MRSGPASMLGSPRPIVSVLWTAVSLQTPTMGLVSQPPKYRTTSEVPGVKLQCMTYKSGSPEPVSQRSRLRSVAFMTFYVAKGVDSIGSWGWGPLGLYVGKMWGWKTRLSL
jgi:hypothetical protein